MYMAINVKYVFENLSCSTVMWNNSAWNSSVWQGAKERNTIAGEMQKQIQLKNFIRPCLLLTGIYE